jgi:hypothetical protein
VDALIVLFLEDLRRGIGTPAITWPVQLDEIVETGVRS